MNVQLWVGCATIIHPRLHFVKRFLRKSGWFLKGIFIMTFAERLKKARENANITQTKLAEQSGVSLRTIQNWENGVRKPSNIDGVTKIAEVLGVSATELIDGNDEFVMAVGAQYGSRGRKGAEKVLADVNALFAGGEMAEDDMDTFMQAVQEAYWKVKAANKKKYTPKKYRSEGDQ